MVDKWFTKVKEYFQIKRLELNVLLLLTALLCCYLMSYTLVIFLDWFSAAVFHRCNFLTSHEGRSDVLVLEPNPQSYDWAIVSPAGGKQTWMGATPTYCCWTKQRGESQLLKQANFSYSKFRWICFGDLTYKQNMIPQVITSCCEYKHNVLSPQTQKITLIYTAYSKKASYWIIIVWMIFFFFLDGSNHWCSK